LRAFNSHSFVIFAEEIDDLGKPETNLKPRAARPSNFAAADEEADQAVEEATRMDR
jgi:hypothetical protein